MIVDEAGMLGTELSVELFHTIQKSGAKLVLVGDDRQISSVNRGGAFSLLADRYGAIELKDVRRQTIEWQKTASEHLSQGEARSAVHLLQENKAISWQNSKEEALADLLKTWAMDISKNPEGTRQILAHRNVDVDALNQGAREILRQKGKLGEIEISCMTQRGMCSFAVGDRVHLTKTDKEQGLMNGAFGVIESIDPETQKLTLRLDSKKTIEVNPQTYDGLKHGYASTVYKAQGSTLDHVYVLHSNITNQSISYVSLTRQTQSLSLHVSKEDTPNQSHLIRQMSREGGKGASLAFDTKQDIEKRFEEKTLVSSLKDKGERLTTKVKDRFHKNEKFYQYEKPKELSPESPSLSSPVFNIQGKSFGEIKEMCERRLYQDFQKRNSRYPDSDERPFIEQQSYKISEYLSHRLHSKIANPSIEELKLLSDRANYEIDRLPEMRRDIIEEWKEESNFRKSDALKAHMLAERLTSIEGRLYLESQEKGKGFPMKLEAIAREEYRKHGILLDTLAKDVSKQNSLSLEASLQCAKAILRYKEVHGENPSNEQIKKIVQVKKYLEKANTDQNLKKLSMNEKEFVHRKTADRLLYDEKTNDFKDLTFLATTAEKQANNLLKVTKSEIALENSKMNQKEFSL